MVFRLIYEVNGPRHAIAASMTPSNPNSPPGAEEARLEEVVRRQGIEPRTH